MRDDAVLGRALPLDRGQVLKVSAGTCQQFVENAVKISNIFAFLFIFTT